MSNEFFPKSFWEQLQKPSVATKKLSYDQLGEFAHEQLKVERDLDDSQKVDLKVNYSNFANHVFFDSAVSKFNISKDKILNYPYNGSTEEKKNFELSASGYEKYILEQWPRYVGYVQFSGSLQCVSASDPYKKLVFGTSSLMFSADARVDFEAPDEASRLLMSIHSGAAGQFPVGCRILFSSTIPTLLIQIKSGSTSSTRTINYSAYTGSWHNIAGIYDRGTNIFSAYIDGSRINSASVVLGPIEQNDTTVYVGGGFNGGYGVLSGAINNVRLYFTASELLLQKDINRQINSENYVKLNYKFNEGIVGTSSVDQIVIDYSKSNINGLINKYSENTRISGTSKFNDFGDSIQYSFHSGVVAFTSSIVLSASQHDKDNNNLIFRLLPENVLKEDDNQDGLLRTFSLVMARYFDELKLNIDQFDKLKTSNYSKYDETPDLFINMALRYFGWNATNHFEGANPLSFLFGENILSSGSFDTTPEMIRNQFWKRTLNNVVYFLKSKGKRHSIDSFFNVLGINKNHFSLKEYGFVNDKGSIETVRIHKEKDLHFLGIGTGSLSSSFIKVPLLITSSNSEFTVELLTQLPYISASYSSSINEVTGALWQFVDPELITGSFGLFWRRDSLTSVSGAFYLSGTNVSGSSSGGIFSSSNYPVFDGRMLHIAAGLSSSQRPFIELRSIDQDILNFSASHVGSIALTGVFTGSKYDFIIGANSGSTFAGTSAPMPNHKTHGFFNEVRFWTRQLSGSEIDEHTLNFESVGTNDPLESPNPLKLRIALNENKVSDSSGVINSITDLSNHGFIATGSQFPSSENLYKRFSMDMNYISPSIDLKWNENKIRIRNKSKLTIDEVGKDTNEVALEFNLVDALNEDITKILINLDDFHNVIGEPVNKYRDEYVELESYRKIYFERLSREINFTNFFKLFQWFDKKIGTAIKQLLPVRTRFIGGEFVVENHMLERPKYGYVFPIFHTPKEISEGLIARSGSIFSLCGSLQESLEAKNTLKGTVAEADYQQNTHKGNVFVGPHSDGLNIKPRDTTLILRGNVNSDQKFKSTFSTGDEKVDRSYNDNYFYKTKYSGDQQDEINNPNVGVNQRNEWARRIQTNFEGNNWDYNGGYRTGSFIHPKIGQNAYVMNSARGAEESEHFFTGYKKNVKLVIKGIPSSDQEISNIDDHTVAFYHLGELTSSRPNQILDFGPNEAHGTANGEIAYQQIGKFGNAVILSSASLGYLDLSSSLRFINPGSNQLISGTIEFWFKSALDDWLSGDSVRNLFRIGSANSYNLLFLRQQANDQLVINSTTSGSTITDGISSYNASTEWHHYAVTFNSASVVPNVYVYIDGIARMSATFGEWYSESPASQFVIGWSNANAASFSGTYDEIRISNIVRDIPNTWKTYTTANPYLFKVSGTLWGIELSQSLFDANNVLIETGSFLTHFGQTNTTVDYRYETELSFEVSASNTAFLTSEFTVDFKDDNSSIWINYKRINLTSGSYQVLEDRGNEGWRKYNLSLADETLRPRFALDRTKVMFRISSSAGKIYAFRDFKLNFNQQLTNDGVRKYMDIDNTNNKNVLINLNRDILKKVE